MWLRLVRLERLGDRLGKRFTVGTVKGWAGHGSWSLFELDVDLPMGFMQVSLSNSCLLKIPLAELGERLDGDITNDKCEEQDLGKISFDMLRLRCLREVQEAQDEYLD